MKSDKAVSYNPFFDLVGACSLETFHDAGSLTCTHEDVQGFLDALTPVARANFWRADANVGVWMYEEEYDNWLDTEGMDAVTVFYHSGHGGMDGNGVFGVPVGDNWGGRSRAFSNNMAFGNEKLRYLFWSTCCSLRVSGPDNPVRTWWEPNKGGLRMMFGYETTSVDNPDYGRFFWDGWNSGKTFASSFLDASWLISHDQVPVVMAVGADQNEAVDRLNNERLFRLSPAAKGWYQWQWIGTLPQRLFASNMNIPEYLGGVILRSKFADDAAVVKIAQQVGAARKDATSILFDANGNRMLSSNDAHVSVTSQGALNIHFGKANVRNTSLLNENTAIKIAQDFISGLELNKGIELNLGHIRHKFTCGGTMNGSGVIDTPSAIETIVQFRQTHRDVQSVNSAHGLIAVSVDNDGRIVNVYDSTKLVSGETGTALSFPPDPTRRNEESVDVQFKRKIDRILAGGGSNVSVLRETVGYDLSGDFGNVVHQKDIEVDFGWNLKKRYKVRVPLV